MLGEIFVNTFTFGGFYYKHKDVKVYMCLVNVSLAVTAFEVYVQSIMMSDEQQSEWAQKLIVNIKQNFFLRLIRIMIIFYQLKQLSERR